MREIGGDHLHILLSLESSMLQKTNRNRQRGTPIFVHQVNKIILHTASMCAVLMVALICEEQGKRYTRRAPLQEVKRRLQKLGSQKKTRACKHIG